MARNQSQTYMPMLSHKLPLMTMCAYPAKWRCVLLVGDWWCTHGWNRTVRVGNFLRHIGSQCKFNAQRYHLPERRSERCTAEVCWHAHHTCGEKGSSVVAEANDSNWWYLTSPWDCCEWVVAMYVGEHSEVSQKTYLSQVQNSHRKGAHLVETTRCCYS